MHLIVSRTSGFRRVGRMVLFVIKRVKKGCLVAASLYLAFPKQIQNGVAYRSKNCPIRSQQIRSTNRFHLCRPSRDRKMSSRHQEAPEERTTRRNQAVGEPHLHPRGGCRLPGNFSSIWSGGTDIKRLERSPRILFNQPGEEPQIL